MSTTTTLVLIGIGAIVLIVTGIKVSSSDKGDNFSITSMLLFTGILISMTLLGFLMIYRSENNIPLLDFGSVVIGLIPLSLFIWNLKRVYSTNSFFLASAIVFYQILIMIIVPILIFFLIGIFKKNDK